MPTLAEILAAKKAKQEAPVATPAPTAAPIPTSFEKVAEKLEVTSVPVNPTAHLSKYEDATSTGTENEVVKAEAPAKPLTFAEKLALKKQQEAASKASLSPTAELPKAVDNPVIQPAAVVKSSEEKAAPIPASVATTTENPSTDPAVAQAYADIEQRIQNLENASETELEGQMKALKKALMDNPAATELMLDTDIGKMVIALRRLTKEAIVEAEKEKKPGRKPKEKAMPIDADAIAKVFAEL
jgi:hypothetical protein